MKTLIRTIRAIVALAAIIVFGAPAEVFAATWYIDQNGPTAGLWDGTTLLINADLTTTTNWTTSAAGTATTTIFSAANNIQIGTAASDFNGAVINISATFNGNIGGNPSFLSVVSTNAVVNFINTTANNRFNHATILAVTNGSTLNLGGTTYNWNSQLFTFVGNGTITVSNSLGNNDTTGGLTMNMAGGKMFLYQTALSTYGNSATGHGFTLTNGTLEFASPQSFTTVFADFQSGTDQTVKFNGGTFDNISGVAGTLDLKSGTFSFGGNFTFIGSQNMSLGPAAVALVVAPQITVGGNTLTIPGAISDGGSGFGITKAGNGTLALTGANTYTGPTTVNAGTLTVSTTATGNGAYTNGDGATLGVTVASAGQSLAMSSLTLGNTTGGALQFDVGLLSNPTVAPINLGSGALTINGSANPINFISLAAITNYPIVIPLIHYGTVSGNLSSLTFGTFPASTPPFKGYISNDSSGQIIDLVLTNGLFTQPPGNPKPVTWIGSPTGNWDVTTTNWNNAGVLTNYANVTLASSGDPVTFDDSLAGTTNVNLTTTLSPASVTVNNANSNYVFSGTGRLSGTASLTLGGTGSLLLDNSGINDFSGGIAINSGALQIGNNDTNGNPGVGAILDNGALIFNRTDSRLGTSAALGLISGSGTLTNNGSGTITFSGVEPFTGTVVVNAGTLGLSGPNSNPSALSAATSLIINAGTVQFQGDNVMGSVAPGTPVTVNTGGVLTGTGTSSHLYGLLTLNGGTLRMDGSQNNTTHGTWDLNGGVTVPGGPVTSTISALNVVPNQTGSTIFNVAAGTTPSGIDLLVSGSLIDASSAVDTGITKNGTGTMVLDNNNSYTNGTIINGGTLQLGLAADAAALPSPLGWGLVTMNTGGILTFANGKGVTVTNTIGDDGTGTVLSISGTNILTGANTYLGPTIVSGGGLVLQNSGTINNSTIIKVSNATLDLSKGGTVINSGSLSLTNSALNLGTNLVSNIGSLAITNSTMSFPIGGGARINVSGSLVTGGSGNVINLTAIPGYPVYPTNITVIKYSSFANVDGGNNLTALTATLPSLGSPAGYLTNNVANQSIDFVLLSDTLTPIFPITWNGRTNGVDIGNWDSQTTSNWVITADGVTPYTYQDLSAVTFDNSLQGTTNVVLTTTVSPGSLTVSNANPKTYTFTGAGRISGTTTLLKTGLGTAIFNEFGGDSFSGGIVMNNGNLFLENTNVSISGGVTVNSGTLTDQHTGTIAGGLTVNGGLVLLDQAGTISGGAVINVGTVQVGNSDANGNLPSGAFTNNDTLIFNRSDTALNITSVISGTGGVTNMGSGTVTWSSTNTFTGPTVVNAGTLILSAGNFPSSGLRSSSGLTIKGGASVQVLTNNSLAGSTPTGGALPILINAGGTLTGAAGANGGTGTSTHIPGLLTLDGGTLANSGTSLQTANGSWDLDSGVTTLGGPVTSVISAFDVIPTQSGGTHFTVIAPIGAPTSSGIDLNVTGSLINGSGLHDSGVIIDGNGTVAFSGTNTYILGTTLNAGVLIANGPELAGLSGPLGETGQIIFNGGTLKYSAVNNFDYSARFGAGGLYNIDTAGQSVTFAAAFNSGSLTKIGNGTLSLTGANTYNGDTIVGGGKLITATASLGAGNYTVTNAATLDVQVAAAGAQLVMNNLTLGVGASDVSTLQIDTLATGNPTVAPVNVSGAVTTNGTVNIALSGTALTANTFPLLAYTGTSPSGSLHFIPPSGFTGSLADNHAGLISVTIAAQSLLTTNANITKVTLANTNLVIHGTNNNVPNTSFHYVVLTATNITTALSNWTPVVTNTFNSDGTFDYTNPIVPGTPQQYLDVQAVP